MINDDRAPGYWILLLGVPSLLASISLLLVPLTAPQPSYLRYAYEYAGTGHIGETTFPLEFAWLTGLSIQAFGAHGPALLETIFYLLIVISVWALARKGGATARSALFAALAAAIYPRLAEGVTKVWDVELSALLMVLLTLCTVWLLRDGLRPLIILAIAVVFGFSIAQRSNMLLLFPLPLYLGLRSAGSWRRKAGAFVCGGALSVMLLVVINTLAHGSFFLPQNGPYNFVQGHNEFSSQVMLQDQISEPTVALILKADGMKPMNGEADEGDPKLQRYFVHRAFTYMHTHPLEETKLLAVKTWTIFRPDTRLHHGFSPMTVMILCMSLIFPAWVIVLLRKKMRIGLDILDGTFIAAVVLYVIPFLLTACDSRYQIPIEICLLAHMACMAGQPSRDVVPQVGVAKAT